MRRLVDGSIAARVVDLLTSVWGEWFTLERIQMEYEERFGPVNPQSLRRRVHYLQKNKHPDLLFALHYSDPDSMGRSKQILVVRGRRPIDHSPEE